MRILHLWFFIGLTLQIAQETMAQECATNAVLIRSLSDFENSVEKDSLKKMVELSRIVPGIQIEMPYATKSNFTKMQLYPQAVALMRITPARALAQVQARLKSKGLGLKVYDAYRPFHVTCIMWRKTPDRHYVANPMNGSNHNRGLAADVTLVYLKNGNELDLGTGFDNFTDSARYDFTILPENVRANRQLLRSVMRQCGFSPIQNEWWHFNWPDKKGLYEALDIDFVQLLKSERH